MEGMKGDGEDFKRMMFLKGELARTLQPYRNNTEAMLAVLALAMLAKELISLYPPAARADAIEVVTTFLASRTPGEVGGLEKFFIN